MKTLATCNPIEFITQTNRIRRAAESWLKNTKVVEIIKRKEKMPENATREQLIEIRTEQLKGKAMDLLDACFESYPRETAELLGLICFVEPKDLEKHKMTEFLGCFNEIIESPEVVNFFMSLTRLANKLT